MNPIRTIAPIAAVLLVIIVFFSIFSIDRIDAANEGIKVNLTGSDRGVDDIAVVTGWVFYNDLSTNVHEIPLTERTVDYSPFTVTSKDNSVFTIDPTIRYNMIKGSGPLVFKRFRKSLEEIEPTVFYQVIRDATRDVANSMNSDSLMSNRTIFENAVQSQVNTEFTKLGFNLVSLTSGLTPPQSLTDAINLKNVAIQNAIKFTNEAKAEQAKAQISVAQAKGEAEAEVAKAKGRYDAAVFDAKATKEKAAALTPLIVEMERIRKWDGSIKRNDLGTGTGNLLNIQ
jgi:regulator of protease activity HflC (stomatin/prohibitin superfamily)